MKRNYLMAALCLLWTINANALVVSVDGEGPIDEKGLELTINEAKVDPMTGKKQMQLHGGLLYGISLTVTITRSAAGLEDEFCCADQCISGNGETTQTLNFTPGGLADWYVHYTPAPNSHETITYTFTEGDQNLVLTVHFNNDAEAIEEVKGDGVLPKGNKFLRDGIVYIEYENNIYHL